MLLRDTKREALIRIEEYARTIEDFNNLNRLWDDRDTVEVWRHEKHVVTNLDGMEDYELPDFETVIPAPLNHIWWRELMAGNFLDVIFDCPHQIHEFTSSRPYPRYYDGIG